MSDIELIRNDVGFDIEFEVDDADGVDVDLTDSTVKFKMWKAGASTCKINSSCTLTTPAEGKCKYTVQSDDLDTAGDYEAELEITYTSGKIITASGITVKIKEDAPAT